MSTLSQLLSAPGLEALSRLAGPLDAKAVTGVRLEQRPERLAEVPRGSVAILIGDLPGHLIDVAVRDLVAADAAALVLTRPVPQPLPRTVTVLAERGGLALLLQAEGTGAGDLAALVVALDRAASGDASDALARVDAAARTLSRAGGDPEDLAALAGQALRAPVELRPAGPGEAEARAATPAGEACFATPAERGHAATAVRTVLTLAALAAAAGGGPQDARLRSRGRLLAELLTAPQDQATRLAVRGRSLDLPVDGWHVALRLEPAALDDAERYEFLERVNTLALTRQFAPEQGMPWIAAVVDDALVLLWTHHAHPGGPGLRALSARARAAVQELRSLHPQAGLRCGIGSVHRGPLGIRTSAREARAALLRDSAGPVAAHDAAGLDRMLLEWYASDAAREAVDDLLAPVLALGRERAEPLLRTVQVYLDGNNSPTHAAGVLHLHRNAVGARIHRFTALTGADLDDAEQRLALQLACRAWLSA
ncbi:PucR family transcriptional regulator [Streptomyces sp. NPDC002520]